MQPIKDRDNVHVILLEDGSYWMSGGFSGNRDGMKPFKEVAATINKCKKEVFNYFLTPVRYTLQKGKIERR